jgi:hypothetical protein
VSRRIFGVGSRYLAMASEDYNRLTWDLACGIVICKVYRLVREL